ncbi:FERM, RhoGEF and pleckstrin domain-containing protein 1 [Anabarilius grahami]|uniref:FERM, RhoGEF and pleckstrin domain-containing protein 1 n=1 Tax=Anabarilius grahami TaxID=495550 RepID=A0A3N0XKZ9_ANAGA|nr:FERM, RhoGEF and pleckstrin domain-containing protein 1 [Anabarilius grahami]
MVEPEERPSVAGQRLGAPESMGISTLEPGQRPPTMPPGRQISIRVQMLDDTQEVFEVSIVQQEETWPLQESRHTTRTRAWAHIV